MQLFDLLWSPPPGRRRLAFPGRCRSETIKTISYARQHRRNFINAFLSLLSCLYFTQDSYEYLTWLVDVGHCDWFFCNNYEAKSDVSKFFKVSYRVIFVDFFAPFAIFLFSNCHAQKKDLNISCWFKLCYYCYKLAIEDKIHLLPISNFISWN